MTMIGWRIAMATAGLLLAAPAAAGPLTETGCSTARDAAGGVSRPLLSRIDAAACPPATSPPAGAGALLCLALLTSMVVAGGHASHRRSARVVFS